MSMSVGSDSLFAASSNYLAQSSKTKGLEFALKDTENATDEELMDACQSFETYLLEQMFKGMEKTILKDEEEEQNDYLVQFGDKLYEEYAQEAAKSGSLGIAQILYEAMKQNS